MNFIRQLLRIIIGLIYCFLSYQIFSHLSSFDSMAFPIVGGIVLAILGIVVLVDSKQKYTLLISRISVGVLFIFSGFIKANDPLGFSYKLDEYFTIFGTPWMSHVSLWMAIIICAFEIGLGIALLLGAKMKFTAWSLLLMIIFFTFLTFWSWKFDVVKDCGCFGDFLHLKPLQSFIKDLILLAFVLYIFIRRNEIRPILSLAFANILAYVGFLASFTFSLYCYWHLPVIDFRPYAIGKNIPEGMKLPPNAKTDSIAMVFTYKKGSESKQFGMDQIKDIDSTWTYVSREDKVIREGDKPAIHDFSISENGTDITGDVLKMKNVFLLVAYKLSTTCEKAQSEVNDFVALCQKDGVEFMGLTASSPKEIDEFRHRHNSMYNFNSTDETALKTMIRSNPGLMLLQNGTVVAMWHYNDFPTYDDAKKLLKK